jgi:3-hydroxybutyrate dehydrogenase
MSINGKICIVTGAASGIGLAIARRYVADGAKVAIADLNIDAAQKAAADLTAQGPERPSASPWT